LETDVAETIILTSRNAYTTKPTQKKTALEAENIVVHSWKIPNLIHLSCFFIYTTFFCPSSTMFKHLMVDILHDLYLSATSQDENVGKMLKVCAAGLSQS